MHFTIITPSFNQLEFLKRSIASVADQVATQCVPISNVECRTRNIKGEQPQPSSTLPTEHAIDVGSEGNPRAQSLSPKAYSLSTTNPHVKRGWRNDRNDQVVPQASDLKPKALISIHHHIQDADSNDGTVEFLEERRANSSKLIANGYKLSFISEADDGMYDAINKGVAFVGTRHEALGTGGEGTRYQVLGTREEGGGNIEQGLRQGTETQGPKPKAQRPDAEGIIAWLNCDEQYLPGTLRKVADFFASNPDVDILFGGMLMVDAKGELLACRKAMPMRRLFLEASYLYNYSCATFFRESLWRKLGGFNTSFKNAGDEDLIRRALELKAKCSVLNDYLATFTYGATNLSSDPAAVEEHEALKRAGSKTSRIFKLPINLLRLGEKFIRRGHVQYGPVEHELYRGEKAERTVFKADHPSCRWPDEKNPYLFGHRLKGR